MIVASNLNSSRTFFRKDSARTRRSPPLNAANCTPNFPALEVAGTASGAFAGAADGVETGCAAAAATGCSAAGWGVTGVSIIGGSSGSMGVSCGPAGAACVAAFCAGADVAGGAGAAAFCVGVVVACGAVLVCV